LNPDESSKQFDEVFELHAVDLTPFTFRAFQWGGRSFHLAERVVCIPAVQGDLWIYECPRYGLHAFSRNRTEALQQFHEEFVFLYDGLIPERGDQLIADALQLRDLLNRDVVLVEAL
jgi:hypothetical protein